MVLQVTVCDRFEQDTKAPSTILTFYLVKGFPMYHMHKGSSILAVVLVLLYIHKIKGTGKMIKVRIDDKYNNSLLEYNNNY